MLRRTHECTVRFQRSDASRASTAVLGKGTDPQACGRVLVLMCYDLRWCCYTNDAFLAQAVFRERRCQTLPMNPRVCV